MKKNKIDSLANAAKRDAVNDSLSAHIRNHFN